MNYSVSETVEYGGLICGEEIIGKQSGMAKKNILKETQEDNFAKK